MTTLTDISFVDLTVTGKSSIPIKVFVTEALDTKYRDWHEPYSPKLDLFCLLVTYANRIYHYQARSVRVSDSISSAFKRICDR